MKLRVTTNGKPGALTRVNDLRVTLNGADISVGLQELTIEAIAGDLVRAHLTIAPTDVEVDARVLTYLTAQVRDSEAKALRVDERNAMSPTVRASLESAGG